MSAGVSALRGPRAALRSATPDERAPDARAAPDRAAAAVRARARRRPSSRSRRSARCTGWRCSSRPPPRAPGTRSASARWRWSGLLGAARLHGRGALARRRRRQRSSALALAFLAGGIADELLRPDRWGELAAGISRGIDALPGARVPYRGIDEWTRLVIPLGGTVLTVVAGARRVLAAPRRASGFPLVALIAARDALRGARRRARLRGRVPARRAAGAARARVPAARAAAARRRPAAPPCSPPASRSRR